MAFSKDNQCTGIYHIHSDYSYDGTNRLERIADWARNQGLHFVLLTEHDLGFDREKFEKYQEECSKHSVGVRLVPGMEYEVIHHGEIVHIGAIGVPVLLDRSVIEGGILSLVEGIHRQGGLAVLHHPNNIRHVLTRKHLEVFDIVELWNTKFDCDFGPNMQFLRWLKENDCQGPYFVSADIHDVAPFGKNRIAHIDIDLRPENLQLSGIVSCLREQRYRCRKGNWTLAPDGTWKVPNPLFNMLPSVCLGKKKVFRLARFFVPEKYQKAVFKFVNRSWIR